MLKGDHLTKEGFDKIRELAKEVNNNPFNYPDSISNDGISLILSGKVYITMVYKYWGKLKRIRYSPQLV
jgi:hypothetical protein